jgi:hypothetical protein
VSSNRICERNLAASPVIPSRSQAVERSASQIPAIRLRDLQGDQALHDALTVLNPRERRIFEARRLTEDPVTLAQLASEYGVSCERVRQIEAKALDKLQRRVRIHVTELQQAVKESPAGETRRISRSLAVQPSSCRMQKKANNCFAWCVTQVAIRWRPRLPFRAVAGVWDLLYFATSIGAASQTSDVSIQTKKLRRLVAVHAVISFFFNTAVLALSINLAATII